VTQPADIGHCDAAAAIATFREAACHNHEEPHRDGAILRLPAYGQAVMTGDLHGHLKNLEKLCKYAMLDRVHARHVILHELIHADLEALADVDHSHELLLAAAAYKCAHPEQVHFLQSNHELAQLTGYLIAKNGRVVCEEYDSAVYAAYGEDKAADVLDAMKDFIASFPIAIRTESRVWMSHSLPSVGEMQEFDAGVFTRPMTREGLEACRTTFRLVWGRRYTQAHIDALADLLDVDVFITGHQPQDQGFAHVHNRLIILASNHSHGTFLPFDLSKRNTPEQLVSNIRKFVEVA
jgi:hypothetical protein